MLRTTAVIFSLCTLLISTISLAKEGADESKGAPSEPTNARELDGLIFIPSRLVRDPFTPTYVNFTTGYGYGQADGPKFDLAGNQIGTRTYQYGAVSEFVQLGIRLTKWLNLQANATATFFTGVNAPSALVVGTTARYAYGAGLLGAWPLGHAGRIGVSFDAAYRPQFDILVANGVINAVRTAVVSNAGVLINSESLFLTPGVTAAYGLSRTFGFGAAVQYTHLRITSEGLLFNRNDINLAAMLQLDLAPVTPVPIAFVAAYNVGIPFEGSQSSDQQASVGIYYSGRTNLVLGLDIGGRWFDIRDEIEQNVGVVNRLPSKGGFATMVIRYYWQ